MWEGLWLNSVFQNRFWEIKKGALTGSHVAYGLFVLICCWAGAQMLSMLIHAPGVFERLMQARTPAVRKSTSTSPWVPSLV